MILRCNSFELTGDVLLNFDYTSLNKSWAIFNEFILIIFIKLKLTSTIISDSLSVKMTQKLQNACASAEKLCAIFNCSYSSVICKSFIKIREGASRDGTCQCCNQSNIDKTCITQNLLYLFE